MDTFVLILIAAAVMAAVSLPLLRAGRTAPSPTPAAPSYPDDAAIDAAVERYRTALRAATVCERCRYPNPAESRYCADCGHGIRVEGDR